MQLSISQVNADDRAILCTSIGSKLIAETASFVARLPMEERTLLEQVRCTKRKFHFQGASESNRESDYDEKDSCLFVALCMKVFAAWTNFSERFVESLGGLEVFPCVP